MKPDGVCARDRVWGEGLQQYRIEQRRSGDRCGDGVVPIRRQRRIAVVINSGLCKRMNDGRVVNPTLKNDLRTALDRIPWGENHAVKAAVREIVARVLAGPAPVTLMEWRERADAAGLAVALHDNGGNISAAARTLGISRVTMYRLMQKHGIA
jgi:transcriptional regulator of acetoin/glycerol metabolism